MTMREKLQKFLDEKEQKRGALVARAEKSEDVKELRGINVELEAVVNEIKELRGMIDALPKEPTNEAEARGLEGLTEDEVRGVVQKNEFNPIGTYQMRQQGAVGEDEKEKRYAEMGKALKENRSVTVGGGSILLQAHQATDIKETFNQVSSLIDRVTQKPFNGGESYKRAYEKGHGEGGYTAEGAEATLAEPKFGYAEISKAKITAYAEETEEIEKLPAAQYGITIENSVQKAIRRKIAKEILVGDGTTNHLMGIFNSTVIEAATDLEVSKIDENTLNEIMFSFGGDEEVEDAAVLILNKLDLKAFSQLRTTDGKKLHTIVANGNVGTIDGVPYIINSACNAVSKADTVVGKYCMAYGPLSNYELAIFSDIETKKSTEYKFKEGMICHRGVAFAGGNVAAHNGFIRIKKKA